MTKGEQCIVKYPQGEVYEVDELHSKLKEADPRLAFHAVHASSLSPDMKGTLYFRQGVGNDIEYHDVSSLATHLGEHCCKNIPSFHALTGCDFTYPFYRRTKFQSFTMMMNLKKTRKRSTTVDLLDTLGTHNPNYDEIIDFILHTVYNRPSTEKTPKDSRVAMLFSGTAKNRKF